MGLLQNFARINAEPLKYVSSGVLATAAAHRDRSRWNIPAQFNNQFITEADNYDGDGHSQLQKAGKPYGYGPPYQFVMPIKSGSMLANVSVAGTGSLTLSISQGINLLAPSPKLKGIGAIVANAFLGYYMQALAPKITGEGAIVAGLVQGINLALDPLFGDGTIDADLGYLAGLISILEGVSSIDANINLPIGMSTNIAGQGSIVANLVGLAILLAALEGEGTIDADFRAMAQLACGLEGDGDLVNPALKAIAWCVANILGEGEVDGTSNLRGDGYMAANITVSGDIVTAQSCAAAVWNALAAMYSDPGSFGKYVGDLGAGANPWESVIEGTHTAQDIFRYLLAFIGGNAEGAGTSEITFMSTGGTKTRIRMTVDDQGNRSLVVLNGDDE